MVRRIALHVALLLVAAGPICAPHPTPRVSADTAAAADSLRTMDLDPVAVSPEFLAGMGEQIETGIDRLKSAPQSQTQGAVSAHTE